MYDNSINSSRNLLIYVTFIVKLNSKVMPSLAEHPQPFDKPGFSISLVDTIGNYGNMGLSMAVYVLG